MLARAWKKVSSVRQGKILQPWNWIIKRLEWTMHQVMRIIIHIIDSKFCQILSKIW